MAEIKAISIPEKKAEARREIRITTKETSNAIYELFLDRFSKRLRYLLLKKNMEMETTAKKIKI
ncbi:MAG: hypothetical protein AAGH81_03860 [Bacteroidota bacterium]